MTFTRPNALDLAEAADVERLPMEQKAIALFNGTRTLHRFAEEQVVPILQGQLNLNEHEQALLATYRRMTLLLRGLSALADPCHFQFAAIVARCAFELLLDIKILDRDPNEVARFFAFRDVAIFYKAAQLRNFLQEHSSVDAEPHRHALQFASDPERQKRIEQECMKHWPASNGRPNWPKHWSGKDMRIRARDAGSEYEEIYCSTVFLQSYYVHAGPAGIQNLSRDALVRVFGISHGLIQRFFAEATEIICNRFKLFVADSAIHESLRRARAASGFFAVQDALDAGPD
jgi:hypothetical protein